MWKFGIGTRRNQGYSWDGPRRELMGQSKLLYGTGRVARAGKELGESLKGQGFTIELGGYY